MCGHRHRKERPMIGHFVHGTGAVRAIALHGWFSDSEAFAPMLRALDPTTLSIAFMDGRGYGRSRDLDGPFDMATLAADAIALADHLGWNRFTLIGHSMGGKAALAAAIRAPGRVERICGITPVWAAPAPFDPDTLGFFRSAAASIGARQAILHNTTGGRLPVAWSQGAAERSAAISTATAFAAYLESWALDDFASAARNIDQPTLVIAGRHDVGVPEDWIRQSWLASLPQAELTVLPEAGHYPMDECPLILAATLTDFLMAAR